MLLGFSLIEGVIRYGLWRARVVKSVDTADLKSADSKKSCRFDSGLGHQPKFIEKGF